MNHPTIRILDLTGVLCIALIMGGASQIAGAQGPPPPGGPQGQQAGPPPPPNADAPGPPQGPGFGAGPGFGPGQGPPPFDPAELFKQMDKNGDKVVSEDEFMEFHKNHGPGHRGPGGPGGPGFGPGGPGAGPGDNKGPGPDGLRRMGPPDPNQLFDQIDQNRDDSISRQEFLEFHDHMRRGPGGPGGPGGQGGPGGGMKRMGPPDGGDRPGPARSRDEFFSAMDANKDGTITKQEFDDFHAKLGGPRPPQPPDASAPAGPPR